MLEGQMTIFIDEGNPKGMPVTTRFFFNLLLWRLVDRKLQFSNIFQLGQLDTTASYDTNAL